jgi:Bacterial antitoxin of type II TA system, VapB
MSIHSVKETILLFGLHLIYTYNCVKIHTRFSRGGSPVATNLALDDNLIEEARKVGNHKTKKEAVSVALQEYVSYKRQLKILEAFGTVDFDPSYDYKAERRRKRNP